MSIKRNRYDKILDIVFIIFMIIAIIGIFTRGDREDPGTCSLSQYGNSVFVNTSSIEVYDGDTFFCNIEGWPPIVGKRIGIRLNGIDTPEMYGEDKEHALEAKIFSESMLKSAKSIELRNIKRGKYFRIIADVYVSKELSLNESLLNSGLAKEYE